MPINSNICEQGKLYAFLALSKDCLSAPSANPFNPSSTFRILLKLVMSSSSSRFSDSIVNVESSVTSSLREVSSVDRSMDRSSKGPGCDWVDASVLKIPTSFRVSNSLDQILAKNSFIKSYCPSDAVMADICGHTDQVCHGRENASQDFFFVHNTFFSDLHITLLCDDFTMGVLRFLNVAPTQLHPNSWVSLQAFRVLCDLFKLIPTPESFLFYYNTRPNTPVSWLSLFNRSRNVQFAVFTTSYKFFKENIFQNIRETGWP